MHALFGHDMEVPSLRAEKLSVFIRRRRQAWDLAQREFVYRDAVQTQKMVYGAIRGMVDALGDDGHTRFLTPDEVKTERSSMREASSSANVYEEIRFSVMLEELPSLGGWVVGWLGG